MSFLLFAVTGLHGLGLLFLFIAILDKGWWVLPDGGSLNLWIECTLHNSTHGWVCASTAGTPRLRAVQGVLVGALLLSSAALILFLWQLHSGPRGRPFPLPAGAQLLAGVAALLGAGLYAAPGPRPPGGRFGHCFVLAWLVAPLALASGVAYGLLRKRE